MLSPKEKWRLILGKDSDPEAQCPLEGDAAAMDQALEALYGGKEGGLGKSSPKISRWLGDIRKYFPTPVVRMMQQDAMDRMNLRQLLMEPEMLENIEPDLDLVSELVALKDMMPAETRETARRVVRKVVRELEKRLQAPMREAVRGALNRSVRNRRPKLNEMDWQRTIRANLKNYQPEYKSIIPEQLWGFGRKGQSLKHVILLVDQSGSMMSSLVYAGVFGAVMASLRALKTQMVVFDTEVADLSQEVGDPVDLLFGIQLGGGTDINKALAYAEQLISQPDDTVLVLISDLYEGGNATEMLRRAARIVAGGTQFISLLALDDEGTPGYDARIAAQYHALGIPTFACTPDQFPGLMATALQKGDVSQWMGKEGIAAK